MEPHFSPAHAQIHQENAAAAECEDPRRLPAAHFYGRWSLHWLDDAADRGADGPPAGEMRLGASAEYPDGLRGTLLLDGRALWIAGDVDEDGDLALEQSADGVHIDATWIGAFTDGSCAREVRGTWIRAADGARRPFLLRQHRGW